MRIGGLLAALALATGITVVGAPAATAASGPRPIAAPVAVPIGAMLQPEDVGPGWRVTAEETMGDWTLAYVLSLCDAASPYFPQPLASRGREMATGEHDQPGYAYTSQEVARHTAGSRAVDVIRSVRRSVEDCAEFTVYDGSTVWGTTRLSVVANGFAGSTSVLVRDTFTRAATGEVSTRLFAFVRKGALLTEISLRTSDGEGVRIARRAADRM